MLIQSDVLIAGHSSKALCIEEVCVIHCSARRGRQKTAGRLALAAGIEGSQLVIQALWIAELRIRRGNQLHITGKDNLIEGIILQY